MQESFGREYHSVSWDRMWEDTYRCTSDVRDEALNQEVPEGYMCFSGTYSCFSPAGEGAVAPQNYSRMIVN